MSDPLNIGQAFFDMTARMMANPAQLVQAQMMLWQDYLTLWQTAARRMLGEAGRAGDQARGGRPALQGFAVG